MQQRVEKVGGEGSDVKKSSSTKLEWENKTVERMKNVACETVLLLILNTHRMANIIVDDGHFAKEKKKAEGSGEGEKNGLMYLIIRWS